MRNMITGKDGFGNAVRIHFDIVDGNIQNVTAEDKFGPFVVENLDDTKEMIAVQYTQGIADATEMFKTGQAWQVC